MFNQEQLAAVAAAMTILKQSMQSNPTSNSLISNNNNNNLMSPPQISTPTTYSSLSPVTDLDDMLPIADLLTEARAAAALSSQQLQSLRLNQTNLHNNHNQHELNHHHHHLHQQQLQQQPEPLHRYSQQQPHQQQPEQLLGYLQQQPEPQHRYLRQQPDQQHGYLQQQSQSILGDVNHDQQQQQQRQQYHQQQLQLTLNNHYSQHHQQLSTPTKPTAPISYSAIVAKSATFSNTNTNTQTCGGATNLLGFMGLYVGNLSPELSKEQLEKIFSKYGEPVKAHRLIRSPVAFIKYENTESPRAAIDDLYGLLLPDLTLNPELPLKLHFDRNDAQLKVNYRPTELPREDNGECYAWRTTVCKRGKSCPKKHIPINKGIDFQMWMIKSNSTSATPTTTSFTPSTLTS